MEERKMIATDFIKEGHAAIKVLNILDIPRSSYYYRPKKGGGRKGRKASQSTMCVDGSWVSNEQVVRDIEEILGEEFVDYGYLKVTHWLRQEKDYIINPKKVYRLMGENGLLNKFVPKNKGPRNWVKKLLPDAKQAFDYLEFDIKYFYVAGQNRNALLLSIIDVSTRWVMGHYLSWEVKHQNVIDLFDQLFEVYPLPKKFYVRNDNGSQFIAHKVQKYFEQKEVHQEFCKPATPEQNAHIESYHSIQEKVICQRYEFGSFDELASTLNRFVNFYNFRRIHSGTKYQAPAKFILQQGIDMNQFDLDRALDCVSLQSNQLVENVSSF